MIFLVDLGWAWNNGGDLENSWSILGPFKYTRLANYLKEFFV